jgi:hypothetical protein
MAVELTTDQARSIVGLRARWPGGEVRAHQRPWGVIVEVRQNGRTVALTAFDGDGRVHREQPLRRLA